MSTELNSSQPVARVIVALDTTSLTSHYNDYGKMAERSKACDSSESLPASAGFSSGYPGVGSNPTLVNFFFPHERLVRCLGGATGRSR